MPITLCFVQRRLIGHLQDGGMKAGSSWFHPVRRA
jgi:hypothetical protein